MKCEWHLCETELSGRQRKFCSIGCKNKYAVSSKRRRNKSDLVAEHGGQCIDCGFTGPPFVFDFDHREPEDKKFGVGAKGVTLALDRLREEALKCDLVCANCHRFRTHKQRCAGCEYCATQTVNL